MMPVLMETLKKNLEHCLREPETYEDLMKCPHVLDLHKIQADTGVLINELHAVAQKPVILEQPEKTKVINQPTEQHPLTTHHHLLLVQEQTR
jgi:hypothetical protein